MRVESGQQDALLLAPEPTAQPVTLEGVEAPVARVIVDSPLPHLDRLFDYLVPPEFDAAAQPGTRVMVPFAGKQTPAWVWERGATTTHPKRLTKIRRVISPLVVAPAETRRLVEAVAERCAGTRSDVLRLAIPARHAGSEKKVLDSALPERPSMEWRPDVERPLSWGSYDGGTDFLRDVSEGGAPRAAWSVLPGRDELGLGSRAQLLAEAIEACLSSERGALLLTATTRQAETLAADLTEALAERDIQESIAVLSAEFGPAQRYRAFVKALTARSRIVVGTRAAAFAPVTRLGLAVMWDDGDDRFDEPHAPYMHARTVLALRSAQEEAALLLAGYSRSVEAESYVAQGWARSIEAPRPLRRAAIARIEVPGAPELEAEGASGRARIPSLAHRALREALGRGPVLIQVPRHGYAPVVSCASCRMPAHCPHCSGPLAMTQGGKVSCRWCGRSITAWQCEHCGHTRLRMNAIGTQRTAEELGRAFPNTSLVVSGARESHGIIESVDVSPRLVIATPGAEPVAEGGYHAVLLLDGATLSARPELGASSEALRRWSAATVLARPDARVILLGYPDESVAGAFLRWDHAGFARRELTERMELGLPPAWRCARIDGPTEGVEAFLTLAQEEEWDVLGPVERPSAGSRGSASAMEGPHMRALLRVPLARGKELAKQLRTRQRQRSAARLAPVRVELDPTLLW